jgi:hypothetical protein
MYNYLVLTDQWWLWRYRRYTQHRILLLSCSLLKNLKNKTQKLSLIRKFLRQVCRKKESSTLTILIWILLDLSGFGAIFFWNLLQFFTGRKKGLTKRQEATKKRGTKKEARHFLEAVLRIHDILGWIRIRGSLPLTNGSVIDLQDANKKLICLLDPDPELDPDPYLWIMDPDPGGPKTRGSGETGTGSATVLGRMRREHYSSSWSSLAAPGQFCFMSSSSEKLKIPLLASCL